MRSSGVPTTHPRGPILRNGCDTRNVSWIVSSTGPVLPRIMLDSLKPVEESISQVEYDCLRRVFTWMDGRKDSRLDAAEISDVLQKLGHKADRREVELMIWEVDEDLDDYVSWDEFLIM